MNFSLKEFTLKLELNSTKDILFNQWFLPIKPFLIKNIDKSWGDISVEKLLAGWDLKKSINKSELLKLCAQFYYHEAMVIDYFNSLSPISKTILEKATWRKQLNRGELEEIAGKTVLIGREPVNPGWYSTPSIELIPEFKEWASFITMSSDYGYRESLEKSLKRASLFLSLPPLQRQILSLHLPKPKGYYLEASGEPLDSQYIFNVETDIFRELPMIISYYLQGNVKYSQKGYPNTASARKMSRTLKLKEFQDKEDIPLRGLMMAGLFSDNFKAKSIVDSPLDIIKFLFAKDFNKQPVAPYLLTHLKGLNYFTEADFEDDTTPEILRVMSRLPLGQWVTFENFLTYLQSHFIKTSPLTLWKVLNKLTAQSAKTNGIEISLNLENISNYVEQPYVAGHLYLLASFGLIELAINTKSTLDFSPYDGLSAFRLTGFGAFIFGLTDDYTALQNDNKTKLLFDENSTIIRIEGNIELGDTMLANYATKVSGNRYQFSPGKFLKECQSTNDVQNKIVLFKQTVQQKLPAFWENYLQKLIDNSKVIKRQSKLHIYNIPAENKDLQRLVAQDEVLRSVVIKAEKFYLLIPDIHFSVFVNRMKELGYILS